MPVYEKLAALDISLPAAIPSAALFAPCVQTGDLCFLSGHIARRDGKPWVGQLGVDVTTAQAKEAARAVAIDLLATLQAAAGDLDRVRRLVKLLVLVNSAPTFTEHHLVANGASELLAEIFGNDMLPARSSFGVAQLPFGSCVEIEMVAEVRS